MARGQGAHELGSDEKYEIVLVLDNTYSMKGQKVKDLVKAADTFMDLLEDKPNADIRVGLVPFSRYVNVGLKNRGAVWLDVPPDSSTTRYVCSNKRDVISKTNCRWEWRTRLRDGIEERYQRKVCDKVYGEPYEVCRNRTNRTTWHGCVGSRDHPLDTQAAYDSKPIPGLMDIRCGLEIKPLSADLKLAKRKLKKMLVNDETYLPAGFLWGWRLLTNQHPFTEAAPKGPAVRKVMVMMTDGETTASPRYPKHTGNDTEQSDAIMRQICERAKTQDDIRIITIKVDNKKNAKKKTFPGGGS